MLRSSVALATSFQSIICTIILIGSMAGCQRSLSVENLVMEAQQYRQRGESQAAIIQLKNAIQKDPENQQARIILGQIYIDIGDPLSAEKEFRKALSLGSNLSEIMPQLGKSMLMLGRAEQLLTEMNQTQINDSQPELSALLANALLAVGKIEESRHLFDKILKTHPGFSQALLGMAKIEIAQKQFDKAAILVEQALAKNPNDIDSLYLRGDLLALHGDSDKARATYGKILEMRPESIQAHIDIANLDGSFVKFDDARNHILAARKIAPSSLQVMQAQAFLDFREGKFKASRDMLQKVLLAAPNHMPSILLMGVIQIALGSPQQAEQYFIKFIQANPKHIYANQMLASIKLKEGQTDSAIKIINNLLANNPDNTQLLTLAGEVELSNKDFRRAAEHLRKASNLAPKSSPIRTALAISLLGINEKAQAIVELEQANALNSTNIKAGTMLVMTHLREKENDKATRQISLMERQNPNDPAIQNLKGAVFLAKGDLAGARSSFEKALNLKSEYMPALQNLALLDMAEKTTDKSKKRFEIALSKNPKNFELMAELAKLAIFENKPIEAQHWLERARAENPTEPAPALLLGNAYLKFGEKQKALLLAQNLYAEDSSNPNILALLAQAQNDCGQKNAALESYNKLAILLPRSPIVKLHIGNLYLLAKNQTEALRAFKKALTLDPGMLAAQTAVVSLLTIQGEYFEASTIAQSIQKQHPDFADGYKLEGDIFMAQNKPLPALKLYDEAFKKSASNAIVINIHQALTLAKKYDAARLRVNDWLRLHPSDLLMRFYLASNYISRNQYALAIEQLELILQQSPDNIVALNDLAVSYQQIKDKRALITAQRAYELQMTNPNVLDTLGWIMLENGDAAQAIKLLKKAIELAPNSPEMRYHLGIALLKYGDKKGAKTELEYILRTYHEFHSRAEASEMLSKI